MLKLGCRKKNNMAMPLKFQFQLAGVDFSRPSSPYRKWLRMGGLITAFLLTAVAYWGYLHHLTHHVRPVSHAAATTTATATAKAATTGTDSMTQKAEAKIAAAGSMLVSAVQNISSKATATMAPASSAPMETALQPEAAPVAKAVASSSVMISTQPVILRPMRVHTDEEKLLWAAQTAFANVIDNAGKNPDAYGFQGGDFLSDAKLGEAMPVYTIEESARAGYRGGQPVKPLLKPAKQWVFPVLMGDRVCCMVEVKQSGHDYAPGKGSKSLAMAWNKIQELWPAAEGYHPMLLVNAAVPGYYFTVPELPVQNITDVSEMFYLHPGTSPADVILASWR